jgi:BirA family biotin operon repressor/biotin-[acetyl-CoA-carboxylase] ligase
VRRPALEAAELAGLLSGTRFADGLELRGQVDSTIAACRELADAGAPEGTTVIAESQRRGRGQRGRSWHSPSGAGLYLSTLLRPRLRPEEGPTLVALAGLAAAEALAEQLGEGVLLKRPNDLLALEPGQGWRKVGGILVDTAVQGAELRHAIVSLGLNVDQLRADFPEALRGVATSLRLVTGRPGCRAAAARAFLRRLEATCRDVEAPERAERIAARLERWESLAEDRPELAAPAWSAERTS